MTTTFFFNWFQTKSHMIARLCFTNFGTSTQAHCIYLCATFKILGYWLYCWLLGTHKKSLTAKTWMLCPTSHANRNQQWLFVLFFLLLLNSWAQVVSVGEAVTTQVFLPVGESPSVPDGGFINRSQSLYICIYKLILCRITSSVHHVIWVRGMLGH